MSIVLKLRHVDGIRLRQQSANSIRTVKDNGDVVNGGKEWKFDALECQQDEDSRRVGNDGKKEKLGTYTVTIAAGLRNLVIEKSGKVESIELRNPALRNQMRTQCQTLVPVEKDGKPTTTKQGKPIMEWKNSGPAQYVPPNSPHGVFVGDGQRAIADEMPT